MIRQELIIAICREAGDQGTDEELVEGYQGNYSDDYLEEIVDAAAKGDITALVRMRSDAGLPVLV
jgi:hypothetical protein